MNKGIEEDMAWLILGQTGVRCCWVERGGQHIVKQAGEAGRSQGSLSFILWCSGSLEGF